MDQIGNVGGRNSNDLINEMRNLLSRGGGYIAVEKDKLFELYKDLVKISCLTDILISKKRESDRKCEELEQQLNVTERESVHLEEANHSKTNVDNFKTSSIRYGILAKSNDLKNKSEKDQQLRQTHEISFGLVPKQNQKRDKDSCIMF